MLFHAVDARVGRGQRGAALGGAVAGHQRQDRRGAIGRIAGRDRSRHSRARQRWPRRRHRARSPACRCTGLPPAPGRRFPPPSHGSAHRRMRSRCASRSWSLIWPATIDMLGALAPSSPPTCGSGRCPRCKARSGACGWARVTASITTSQPLFGMMPPHRDQQAGIFAQAAGRQHLAPHARDRRRRARTSRAPRRRARPRYSSARTCRSAAPWRDW